MKFALYARCSTEDLQSPEDSLAWQRARAEAILPADGEIVRDYFDRGTSRSLPWLRRPEASRLLADLKDPARGFDAVVIGEPAHAFYGGQFGLTFPLFVHFGVQLWVPDVGGYVDPESDGPEMMMAIYGTMSTQERRRVKMRVRTAMEQQAKQEGRYLGGRPPYGYQLVDGELHPNASKAAHGQRLRHLEPDPVTAPVLRRIFEEYAAGAGIGAIAEGLNVEGIPSPSAHYPARNRHRVAANGAWAKSAVRAILNNPKYTGKTVWNRQRRDEELLDLDDVAAGYTSKMKRNDEDQWIRSDEQTHEALISDELWEACAAQRRVGEHREAVRKPRVKRTYSLSSLIFCGECGRRMTGNWTHNEPYYRCGFRSEYAGATGKHPRWVYLRERDVTPKLDEWLLAHFDPENIDATIAAMAAAQAPDDAAAARTEAARKRILDCDARLAKYRTALEGGDSPTIAGWVREVEAERLAAQRELDGKTEPEPMSEDEVRALVEQVKAGLVGLATKASPAQKAAMYRTLGLKLTYHPETDTLDIEARPDAYTRGRVGGGT